MAKIRTNSANLVDAKLPIKRRRPTTEPIAIVGSSEGTIVPSVVARMTRTVIDGQDGAGSMGLCEHGGWLRNARFGYELQEIRN